MFLAVAVLFLAQPSFGCRRQVPTMSAAAVDRVITRRLESATEIRVRVLNASGVLCDRGPRTISDRVLVRRLSATLNVKRTHLDDAPPCTCAFYIEVAFDGQWGFYVPGGISDTILHDENFNLGLDRESSRDFLETTLEPTFLRTLARAIGVDELWMLPDITQVR